MTQEIKDLVSGINTAFDEYKKTNDARIEAIKGNQGTADLDAKLAKMDAALDGMKSMQDKMETRMSRPGAFEGKQDGETKEAMEYRQAFSEWARAPGNQERQQKAYNAQKAMEAKSAQVVTSTGSAGGFALPEVIERSIARLGIELSPIRGISTVRTVGSPDYKELFDLGGAGFEWIGETDTRAQTNTPDMAEVAPTFGMASAKPQATEESLDDLFFNVEDWIVSSAAEAIYAGEGAAFVSGNGTKKPTGFLAGPTPVTTGDASRAFGTLQYIASGGAAALPTSADVFLDMVYRDRKSVV